MEPRWPRRARRDSVEQFLERVPYRAGGRSFVAATGMVGANRCRGSYFASVRVLNEEVALLLVTCGEGKREGCTASRDPWECPLVVHDLAPLATMPAFC